MQTQNSTPAGSPLDRPGYGGVDLLRFLSAILIVMIHVVPPGNSQNSTIQLLNHALRLSERPRFGWLRVLYA